MCSFRQRAIARSLNARRSWPRTRISPSVGRSMAAVRWSKVDLPEPDGPISATNSPRVTVMLTFFSATTWNSSRMYSFESWRVSMTISGIGLALFRPHLLSVFEIGGWVGEEVFASDETFRYLNTLRRGRIDLDRLADGLAADDYENTAVTNR